ncbi:uncharacterized protein F4822DRAFT_432111 [Hypoxylon trugodes]|uniref:uncharacterized protein n=1 Tax=Hypoxylon trugodes TaxID=326681 RepID=UPI00219CFE0B|nr:uncharacterized protein F4822DRAFT_432111 [Hypoxylon trugodes]KAI1385264.1 hypothetical protein F4822DRAFT_432111 [Hypoxylon trugodes]
MDRLHPLESMHSVIRNALPNITVESINPLPSYRLLRFFSIKISDGRTLILSLPPPPTLRLLRSERAASVSESLLTKWLLEGALQAPIQAGGSIQDKADYHPTTEIQLKQDNLKVSSKETINLKEDVLRFLPILVAYSLSSTELGSPFNIFEPTRGVPLSKLPTPLTTPERKVIDLERGQLIRRLSNFTSPNGVFGPVTGVINTQLPTADTHGTQLANQSFRGARTWKHAFHSLLESVLRDAEDMAVTISYEPIRGYFNRLGYLLDGIKIARLVLLDAGDDSNVLVSRLKESAEEEDRTQPQPMLSQETKTIKTEAASEKNQEDKGGRPPDSQRPVLTVTGLRDWSNCIFGDPLFAEAFNQDPSPEFLRGFRESQEYDTSGGESKKASKDGSDNLVEDCENVPGRLLLYECYHATVAVVKQFYRPGPNSSDREITARRRLATALKRLQEVEEEAAGKRPRRPSANVEAWPVKKSRGDKDSPIPSVEDE